MLYIIYIIILWDHRCICGPSLTEMSFCDAYLYRRSRDMYDLSVGQETPLRFKKFESMIQCSHYVVPNPNACVILSAYIHRTHDF
jgi:hypothetical protein